MNKPDSTDARREAFLQNTRDRATAAMTTALQRDADPTAMSQAVQTIHSLTDENMAMIEQSAENRRKLGERLPQVACKKGCDYCCTMRVRVAAPEALAIAEQITNTWTEKQIAELLENIERYQAQFENLTPSQRINKMVPCPLLRDHLCSIHPSRPIACRRHHSMDVQACIEAQKHPDKVQIPHYLQVTTVTNPIMTGLQNAMRSKNLRSAMVTLVPALEIALKDPDAKQKWLAGQDVFAKAVDKGLDELAFAKAKKIPTFEI